MCDDNTSDSLLALLYKAFIAYSSRLELFSIERFSIERYWDLQVRKLTKVCILFYAENFAISYVRSESSFLKIIFIHSRITASTGGYKIAIGTLNWLMFLKNFIDSNEKDCRAAQIIKNVAAP